MILYKVTGVKTGEDLIGKNLINEIRTFDEKHYIIRRSLLNATDKKGCYEVDKNSLVVSLDDGKTWAKVEEDEFVDNSLHVSSMEDFNNLPTTEKPISKTKPMTKTKQILLELDKGKYDNFTDRGLLTVELMRDFQIFHTPASYLALTFFHYKGKD